MTHVTFRWMILRGLLDVEINEANALEYVDFFNSDFFLRILPKKNKKKNPPKPNNLEGRYVCMYHEKVHPTLFLPSALGSRDSVNGARDFVRISLSPFFFRCLLICKPFQT